jgi:hypothetical protein
LVLAGGVVLVAVFVAVHRIQASLHNVVLATGPLCWVAAGALLLADWSVSRVHSLAGRISHDHHCW